MQPHTQIDQKFAGELPPAHPRQATGCRSASLGANVSRIRNIDAGVCLDRWVGARRPQYLLSPAAAQNLISARCSQHDRNVGRNTATQLAVACWPPSTPAARRPFLASTTRACKASKVKMTKFLKKTNNNKKKVQGVLYLQPKTEPNIYVAKRDSC